MSEHEIAALKERIAELEKADAERTNTEEELKASEARYRRLFEAAKDGILILDAETGMIVDVNPFLIGLLGFSREQFLGKKIWEIGFLKDVIANQANFLELQQKEYIRYENLPLETFDARKINVEFVSNVYRVNNHKVIQCNIRDITERKKAEEEIKAASEEWQRTFDAISDLVFIQDRDFTIIKVNKAFADALKAKPEDIIGKRCYELLHKRNTPWDGCPFEMSRKDKKPHTQEVDDPNIGIPLLVTTSPIFDNKGELAGSVHVSKDISEMKKVEKELKKKMRDLEAFHKLAVGRELKMEELKKRIAKLEEKLKA